MRYPDFKDEITRLVNKVAPSHNPEIVANTLYFLIKQNPHSPVSNVMSRKHQSLLRILKTALVKLHGWDMREAHQFLCKYNSLVGHMKKRLDKKMKI